MSGEEALIRTNTIIEAINGLRQNVFQAIDGLRQEMNERFDKVDQRFNNIEARLRFVEDKVTNIEERVVNIEGRVVNIEERVVNIEKRVTNIESEFFSFNVRLKRVEAGVLEALSIGKNLEADVMLVKAEIESWSHDIFDLQKRVA